MNCSVFSKMRSKRNKKIPSNLEGFVLSTNSKVKNTVTKDGDMGFVMGKNGNGLDFNSTRRDNVRREYSISRDASVKRDGYGDKQNDDEGFVEDLNGPQFPSINSTPKNCLGEEIGINKLENGINRQESGENSMESGEKNKSGNENNKRFDDTVKSGDRKEDKTVKDNTGFLRYADVVNINKVENKLQDKSIVGAKLSSRGSMYQTLSYVSKLSSRGSVPDVCDIRTSYVSRQCTSSDEDRLAASYLLRGLATPDWLLLAS
ncbi:hypothetical protein Tco_0407357 [Tanacetum coccineum]